MLFFVSARVTTHSTSVGGVRASEGFKFADLVQTHVLICLDERSEIRIDIISHFDTQMSDFVRTVQGSALALQRMHGALSVFTFCALAQMVRRNSAHQRGSFGGNTEATALRSGHQA